ncbi:unnamed protein product [Dracunculus medinensis]|uniref:L-threonine 3-dehydrogenase, mitochondrial n=1 Tax=Dracunculus medinensis TaxID=318479 RepID=A0A0N4U0V6_DRAME|nr:unnamed protein product [Dracunculus medinensis]
MQRFIIRLVTAEKKLVNAAASLPTWQYSTNVFHSQTFSFKRFDYFFLQADPLAKYKILAENTIEKPTILITGAMGQLGRGIASILKFMYGTESCLMTDVVKGSNDNNCSPYAYLDVLDKSAIEEMVVNHNINTIIHYSAILSAVGETNVPLALKVNGEGMQNVLEVAKKYNLKIFIPSTIGAFGPATPKQNTPNICVQRPRTIYGVTKVYGELLGEYYNERFGTDFRSLRFPGIISATEPGGGTTDYAVKIFYDAIQYGKYKCYLRPETRLPMMYDTDCTASVILYLLASPDKLTQRTYNVTGFSFTPEEIAASIRRIIPNFKIEYEVCPIRQKIADSWPDSLDDSMARKDWGWKPEYDLERTVNIMFTLIERQIREQQNNPKKANM